VEVFYFLAGAAAGVLVTYRRVKAVTKEASTDTLTGLYNRSLLDKTLGRLLALAQREDKPLSILMIDLNDFKEANDRYGHQFGDEVLRRAAQAMVRAIRKSDFIFRYGGDEFLLILPETTLEGAEKTAMKVKSNLSATTLKTPRGGNYDGVAASIGIAAYPSNAKSDQDLIKAADEAVYRAKDKRDHLEVAKNES
jgi:diguanylate cyclase (GGDEF)-like protein